MSGELRITHLRLVGEAGIQVYEFPRRVTVVTGAVGAGKTSLLNAIKYALGGSWQPPQKIRPALQAIEIEGRIAGTPIVLRRPFRVGSGTVSVKLGKDPEQPLEVSASEGLTLSDVLLERLSMPIVKVPEKPSEPTGEERAVSFADVLTLMYLDQAQLETTVGFTGAKHAKWRQTCEVVYGFMTSEIAAIQSDLGQVNSELSRASRYIAEVTRFLDAVDVPLDNGGDDERRSQLATELDWLDRELARVSAPDTSESDLEMRNGLAQAERALAASRAEADAALAEVNAMKRVRAQLQSDVANLERAEAAHSLRELEFEQCPRCMAALESAPSSAGVCRLCHQREPSPVGVLTNEIERNRIRRQQVETSALLDQALARYEQAVQVIGAREKERGEASAAWNAATAAAMAPKMQEVAALSERRGALLRARDTLDRTYRMRTELRNAGAERDRLTSEKARLEQEMNGARAQQTRAHETVRTLGEAYLDLLREMQLRDLETAGVDPKMFVPLVNGESIPALSSGGMKTVASFAYFLATLRIRLRGEDTLLPRFMMIDSPRKGHGKNKVDEDSMKRFYRTLATFARLGSSSEFQVIVADNDTPTTDQSEFGIIEIPDGGRSVDIGLLTGSSGTSPE
jgi:hypothetical protein